MASFLIFISIFGFMAIYAYDFGTCGNTFPIQEQNIIEYLRERLHTASSIEVELFAKKQIQFIKEPKALNLPNAVRHCAFFYDPTVTIKEEIRDDEGNVIVKRGTRYNPLENCSLTADLLLFDATQESHLAWAKANEGVWVLVKGKPLELEELEAIPVYFDQFGYLTEKFGIKAVPAKVSQEGKLLKIEEITLGADR